MEKLKMEVDGSSSSSDATQANPQGKLLLAQRCMNYLVHACECSDANCQQPSCNKMKRVMQHAQICRRKANGGCPMCKQLTPLICYHAKLCRVSDCPLPFCSVVKQQIKQIPAGKIKKIKMSTALICKPIPAHVLRLPLVKPQDPGVMVAAAAEASIVEKNQQDLQQLLLMISGPKTPEHRQQILQILQSNQLLRASFIERYRLFQQSRLVVLSDSERVKGG